jgi:4-hydroxybenzoate polyprenyltransferase
MLLPLLGIATTSPGELIRPGRLLGVVAATFALHLYINLMNDVFDLPYDRQHPGRRNYPLVRGVIKPWQVSVIALGALPIVFAVTYHEDGDALAYLALVLSIGAIAFYNNWGKRFVFPPFTDFLLGIGYASITLYGAAMCGAPTWLTWIVVLWVIAWTLQINLLGSIRDLVFDRAAGARTTPMVAGMRPEGSGLVVPRLVVVYSFAIEAVLFALEMLALVRNDFHYASSTQMAVAAGLIVLKVGSGLVLNRLYRVAKSRSKSSSMLVPIPIGLGLLSIVVLLAPSANGWLIVSVGLTYFIPLRKMLIKPRPSSVVGQEVQSQ